MKIFSKNKKIVYDITSYTIITIVKHYVLT
nr:MAG TPA: hypothetical protein [Caudoviricetes sp.]